MAGLPEAEGGSGLNLGGKLISMFSYGSGCAASMFLIRVAEGNDYMQVIRPANYKKRLESRVKISPEQFDQWMSHREASYGVCPYVP